MKISGAPLWWTARAALLLAIPILPALATARWHPRRPGSDLVADAAVAAGVARPDLATVRAEWAGALWLDAREAGAYAAGHVPGALSLNEAGWDAGFAALMEAWDGTRPLVVYCGGESCHASDQVAARLMRELGFSRLAVLRGGWPAWLAAGGEVER